MKKRIFFQTDVLWQLFCFLLLSFVLIASAIGIQLITGIVHNGWGEGFIDIALTVILVILYFVAVALVLKVFIRLEHNNIFLDADKIYMKDDWCSERDKIQYYAEAFYKDIESIDIIWTKNNSKGGKIKTRLVSALFEKPYLSIRKRNGETANFFIMYFSKRSISKLIDEIRMRMESSGNPASFKNTKELMSKLDKTTKIEV